tara:strand:- start:1262 stop:1393 length:132 start_codon:yes stop_codon:yes gene_type:complete
MLQVVACSNRPGELQRGAPRLSSKSMRTGNVIINGTPVIIPSS